MDGTLVDSTAAVERSWRAWSTESGIPLPFGDDSHGRPAEELVRSIVPTGQADVAVARLRTIEESDTAGIVALPGVRVLLASIPNGEWAIVTSCTRELARVRITAAGLGAPSVFVTFDDVSRGKPDPEPFQLAARLLGVDPARCLVVEDAVAGLVAARAAGCATLAVGDTHTAAELAPYADVVLDGLEGVRMKRVPGVAGEGRGIRFA
ncbi:MAG: HAD-IA family hydrolase [Burkholderiaceae bacterium]|nr:HAD-IA family hydrolase [Microbacteriaceae bacterium]